MNKKTPFYVTIVLFEGNQKFQFSKTHFVDRLSYMHASSADYLPVVVILNPVLDRAAAAAIVCHVCFDKMSSGKSSAQTELTRQDTSGNNASQLTGVFTWVGGMGSSDTEHFEHGRLGLEDSTTSDCADFD